jgi:hypothetical protein
LLPLSPALSLPLLLLSLLVVLLLLLLLLMAAAAGCVSAGLVGGIYTVGCLEAN